jgi:hypothetical protein
VCDRDYHSVEQPASEVGMSRFRLQIVSYCFTLIVNAADAGLQAAEPPTARTIYLYQTDFSETDYGRTPVGFCELVPSRPSRAWAVDGRGRLRTMPKGYSGLLRYDGYLATGEPARTLVDGGAYADFTSTGDAEVAFGVASRVQADGSRYEARFVGSNRLQLVAVAPGTETVLAEIIALRHLARDVVWRLSLEFYEARLTARVFDDEGVEIARVDAADDRWTKGPPGLYATNYAAATTFGLTVPTPFVPTYTPAKIAKRNERVSAAEPDYPVVPPRFDTEALHMAPGDLADTYDVVVAGAGTGGFAAALQAARLGARVLLVEETDWIGGQMCAAGVTTMDEDGVYRKYPVRERGVYREFHESIVTYYRTFDKDPFVAYYSRPQSEGGYEPKAARAILYGLIAETRSRKLADGSSPRLDLCLRTRVEAVAKQGDTITGATLRIDREDGAMRKQIACQILVDATEYGDVLPLAGARYRVSISTSDDAANHLASPIQDHTWTAIVREYPLGVPPHLQITTPPPGYDDGPAKRFKKFQRHGLHIWGAAGKGIKGPRDYRVYFAWRGMADADAPLFGTASELRHTQCGFNGGNDYPVTAATCEDPAARRRDERDGIYRTLGTLYYFQRELGLNWSLAEDEGYDTPYNRAKMKSLELRSDLELLARHLPQLPYVRESRRMFGVDTLKAGDLTRYEQARHVSSSVAMGDYFMDLDHGRTGHLIESDLDAGEIPHGGGPFQVPFEVLIPERLDGFLAAEKNFSQSRLANGATRLQPITMLTGQAVGTVAALAVKQKVQPRRLDVIDVQTELLAAGSTLIQRWYADVPWGTPLWRATQLLSLHKILDRPGDVDRDDQIALGARARWGVDEKPSAAEVRTALARLAEVQRHRGREATATIANIESLTAGELAIAMADILTKRNGG